MANRTVKDAHTVHGTNPQYLVEKIIRSRVYESRYWKEECFAVTAELIVDKGMELRYCGGVYGGNIKPTPFICLVLKMLQIQPEKDIIIEFLRQEDFKYIRALAAIYLRLTASSLDIYKYLEPLYNDYRKLRFQNRQGEFVLSTMDQFVDELLHEERVCDIILPRIMKRYVLEETSELEPRVSLLDDDNEEDESEDEEQMEIEMQKIQKKRQQEEDHDRDRKERHKDDRKKDDRRDRERDRDRDRERERVRERDRDRDRYPPRDKRRRSRSKDRGRDRRRSRSKDRGRDRRRDRTDRFDRNPPRREKRHDRRRSRSNERHYRRR